MTCPIIHFFVFIQTEACTNKMKVSNVESLSRYDKCIEWKKQSIGKQRPQVLNIYSREYSY